MSSEFSHLSLDELKRELSILKKKLIMYEAGIRHSVNQVGQEKLMIKLRNNKSVKQKIEAEILKKEIIINCF